MMRRLLLGAGLTFVWLAVPAWAATKDVDVSGFAYSPQTIQIDPGDTVTWHFSGPDLNHSVTSDDGQSESFDRTPATRRRCTRPPTPSRTPSRRPGSSPTTARCTRS